MQLGHPVGFVLDPPFVGLVMSGSETWFRHTPSQATNKILTNSHSIITYPQSAPLVRIYLG